MSERIVFMGSPEYAAIILKYLDSQMHVVGVVTQPNKRVGRGNTILPPAVKVLAQELRIPYIQPGKINSPEVMNALEQWSPDVIVVAAYGKILKSNILNYTKDGCINVHASLLPRWRGASPVHAAILHGDSVTGVTVMKMDEGIDTGDILSMAEVTIYEKDTTETLTKTLAETGAKLLVHTLPRYLTGEIMPYKQPSENATYAGLIKKSDAELDFNRSAEEIERKIRAFIPWPICYFDWDGKKMKVFAVSILNSNQLKPGMKGVIEKYPCIGTATSDLKLEMIQSPGKRKVDGKMFLNGARNWI